MLANFKYLKGDIKVTINLSTGKKKLYLNINSIHAKLGERLSCALAVCNIFTGNDYNPAFYRKGKKKPINILKKYSKYQEAFIQLFHCEGTELTTSSQIFNVIEEFVCRMYTLKTKSDVNKGRFELFEKSYKCKSENEKILKTKLVAYDASSLPPTKQELLQQIKRTQYICSVWCNIHMRSPTDKTPENHGWTIIEGKYEYYWYSGPQSPSFEELSTDFQEFVNVNDEMDGCHEDENEESLGSEQNYSTDESDED